MIGGGFIADMIARARYNAKLLRGHQLFKNVDDHSPLVPGKNHTKSESAKESSAKFYKDFWSRRGSDKLGFYINSCVVGFTLLIVIAIVSILLYSFVLDILF